MSSSRIAFVLMASAILVIAIRECTCQLHQYQPEEDQEYVAEREIYLRPRNFNPHPLASRTDPVSFPLTVESVPKDDGDEHPYRSLLRKQKYQQAGRFSAIPNELEEEGMEGRPSQDPRASSSADFDALTEYARKIVPSSTSMVQDQQSDVTDLQYDTTLEKQNPQDAYAFSYRVQDGLSGDDFSHVQQRNDGATSGEYRVKLPDGRLQIVKYVADHEGYKADVKYQQQEQEHVQENVPNVESINSNLITIGSTALPYADQNYGAENQQDQNFVSVAQSPNLAEQTGLYYPVDAVESGHFYYR